MNDASTILLAFVSGIVVASLLSLAFVRRQSRRSNHRATRASLSSSTGLALDSELLLGGVLDAACVAVRVCASDTGDTLYASPSFAQLWYGKDASFPQSTEQWLSKIDETEREQVGEAWSAALGGTPMDITYRIERPDGTCRWVRERTFTLAGSENGRSFTVAVCEDATVRRTLESHIRREDRTYTLGTAAVGLAHDINDPLASIILLSGLVLNDEQEPDELKTMIRRIRSEALSCTQVVRQVLQFARDDTLTKSSVQLNATVREATTLLAHHTLERGAEVRLSLEKSLPTMRLNSVAIQQALVNMLKNSCDAGARHIQVSTKRTDRGVELAVEDDGNGLSSEAREQAFDAFYSTKTETGGTGIGLTLAHDIITDHSGSIRIENLAAGGTRIVMELPRLWGAVPTRTVTDP